MAPWWFYAPPHLLQPEAARALLLPWQELCRFQDSMTVWTALGLEEALIICILQMEVLNLNPGAISCYSATHLSPPVSLKLLCSLSEISGNGSFKWKKKDTFMKGGGSTTLFTTSEGKMAVHFLWDFGRKNHGPPQRTMTPKMVMSLSPEPVKVRLCGKRNTIGAIKLGIKIGRLF